MLIRFANLADAKQILEIYAPYCVESIISFETEAPPVEEMRRRIEKTLARWPWIVSETGGRIDGYAYASAHRERAAYAWSVDVSVYVRAAAHRTGCGRSLYRSLLSMLTRLGYRNAFAGIALPNAASVGLHESLGFRPAGVFRGAGLKHGDWVDVGYWHQLFFDVL